MGFSHPWKQSAKHKFDISLLRNQRALKKGAGLPKFGPKRDNLAAAAEYVYQIKDAKGIAKMYSIMPGYRTQQSHFPDWRVRLVWQVPISTWYMECEAYDDAITETISANLGDKNEIKLFYADKTNIHSWIKHQWSDVIEWVNLDATQYDSTVRASELAACVRYFAPDYGSCEQLVEYTSTASLVMPEGDIVRNGGMPSGSKLTNLGDGWTNVHDMYESFTRAKLGEQIKCILVNGDDITIGLGTKLREGNLKSVSEYSRRNISSEKSVVGPFVQNSKWYADENIITRSLFRVLNSAMFKEHQINPITGSKEYVAIALAQQLEDLAMHPLASQVLPMIKEVDKYPISAFTDSELRSAAEAYLDDHSYAEWMGDSSTLVSALKKGVYAKT
jgi:hypothetical protein